jgi:hypothetical protein
MNAQRLSKTGTALLALAIGISAQAMPITGTLDIAAGEMLDTSALGSAAQATSWLDVTAIAANPGSGLTASINDGPWAFNAGRVAPWSVGASSFNPVTSGVVPQGTSGVVFQGTFGAVFQGTFGAVFQAPPGMVPQGTNPLNVQANGFMPGNGSGPPLGNGFPPSPGQGIGSGNSFSFQTTTIAQAPAVPDGGTTALLLGLALIAVGALRRLSGSRT